MKSRLPDEFKKQSVNSMLENAKRVQNEMAEAENEISKREFCATAAGDAVKVIVSGDRKIKELKISGNIVSDLEMLQDMIIVAVNNAMEKASDYHDQKMREITGDLNLPGL